MKGQTLFLFIDVLLRTIHTQICFSFLPLYIQSSPSFRTFTLTKSFYFSIDNINMQCLAVLWAVPAYEGFLLQSLQSFRHRY